MTDIHIPLAKPSLGAGEIEALEKVIRSRYIAQGPEVSAFEKDVIAYLAEGREDLDCCAVSSGGAGLLLSLKAAGIGQGMKVLVPAYTFPAGAQAVLWLNANPVPVDVDEETLSVSPRTLKERLDKDVSLIIVCHQFGIPAEIEKIKEMCNGIPVIEDAACALGGRGIQLPLGTIGDMGCFSLHPRKVITSGEGGLVVGQKQFVSKIRLMRDYGRKKSGFGDCFSDIGLNFRMSDLQAAVARVQLGYISETIKRRERLAYAYMDKLSHIKNLKIPEGYKKDGVVFQSFVVRVPNGKEVVRMLNEKGIMAQVGAHCLTEQTFYRKNCQYFPCPISEKLAKEIIALPFYDEMEEWMIERVVSEIERILITV